jgi:hypothetical protein
MDSTDPRRLREDDKDCQQPPRADAEERTRPEGHAPQAAAPRCLSNTEGLSSPVQRMKGFPDYLISGGLDWFEWSAQVHWVDRHRFGPALRLFQRAKEACQAERKAYTEVHLPDFGPVRIARQGVNRGGDRGQHFEFRLRISGVTIGVSLRDVEPQLHQRTRKRRLPNFFVQQTGRDCLLVGPLQGFDMAEATVTALGGACVEKKLSRADLCLDVCNLHVEDLLQLVEAGQFITSARHVRPQVNYVTDAVSGFTAGQSPIRLVVYDKLAERLGKADHLYNQALIDRRWYGRVPEAAARVEYQIHRQWLLDQGITTPEDLLSHRGRLCQKLTYDWFRLTAEPVDRRNKHQSRAGTHLLWIGIQEGFETVFGPPEGELPPIRRDKITPTELARQARGCLANCLLQMAMPFETYGEFAEMARRVLLALPESGADAGKFMAEVERRKMEFETS